MFRNLTDDELAELGEKIAARVAGALGVSARVSDTQMDEARQLVMDVLRPLEIIDGSAPPPDLGDPTGWS